MKKLITLLTALLFTVTLSAQQKSYPMVQIFENYPCPFNSLPQFKNAKDTAMKKADNGQCIYLNMPYKPVQSWDLRYELIHVYNGKDISAATTSVSGYVNGTGLFIGEMQKEMKEMTANPQWHNTTTYIKNKDNTITITAKIWNDRRIPKGYKLRFAAIDGAYNTLQYFQADWLGVEPYNDLPQKKANKKCRVNVTVPLEFTGSFRLVSFVQDWTEPEKGFKPIVNAVYARMDK